MHCYEIWWYPFPGQLICHLFQVYPCTIYYVFIYSTFYLYVFFILHFFIYLSKISFIQIKFHLSIYLFILHLFIFSLFIYLFILHLFIFHLSIYLFFLHLFIFRLSIYPPSIYISIYLSIYVYLTDYLIILSTNCLTHIIIKLYNENKTGCLRRKMAGGGGQGFHREMVPGSREAEFQGKRPGTIEG